MVENAPGRGLSEILEWLDEWSSDTNWTIRAVSEAIRNGYFELANWLQNKLLTASVGYMSIMIEWAEVAAEKGDLEMVKRTCGKLMERDSNGRYLSENVSLWGVVQSATSYGQLHVLKWIMDEPNRKVLLYELLGRDIGDIWIGIDLSCAAARGHITVLTWFIQQYPKLCISGDAGYNAARYGHLDILRLLLSAPIGNRTTPNAIDAAAGNSHLDIVKFLVAEGYPFYTAMDDAAEKGFLDIMKWLHENTSHRCSSRAMDGAAANGHLDVVKWLHHNREEVCTVSAMDDAAGHGHLSVVQWLHDNRTELHNTSDGSCR